MKNKDKYDLSFMEVGAFETYVYKYERNGLNQQKLECKIIPNDVLGVWLESETKDDKQ